MGCAEVSTSVTCIIAAFTQCHEVLRKIRSKTRGKAAKSRTAESENEVRLNKSLSRAPAEIRHEYARGVQALGPSFSKGDSLTRILLQTTLAKLNTGLVDIISAFLASKDPTKLRLDYNALAVLSDVTCNETKDGLAQLGQRIARSALYLQPGPPCKHCGLFGHHECGNVPNKRVSPALPAKSSTPKAYIAGVKQANQTQWAVVRTRPQKKRVESTSSTSSSGSNLSANSRTNSLSTNATTLCSTPPASPMGRTPLPPAAYQIGQQPAPRRQHMGGPNASKLQPLQKQLAQQQKKSQGNLRPPQMPAQMPAPLPLKAENLAQIPELRKPPSMQRMPNNGRGQETDVQAKHSQAGPRRRQDKATDSLYSFTSDSTKLGEIPMHRWSTPFDYDEMDRLNAEAGVAGWGGETVSATAVPGKPPKKPGLLSKMFRKAPLSAISET